jgi:hypothetical protein
VLIVAICQLLRHVAAQATSAAAHKYIFSGSRWIKALLIARYA